MASSFTLSTASNKRTFDDVERECREEEAADVGLEVKRGCNKADNDGAAYQAEDGIDGQILEDNASTELPSANDSDTALSEDNPEPWTPQDFDNMWAALDEKFPEWTEEQPHTQEEQTFQEQLGEAGDWNMNEGTPEQEIPTAAQSTNLVSSRASSGGEEQRQRRESVPQESGVRPQPLPISSAVQEVRPHEVHEPEWEPRRSSQFRPPASTDPRDMFVDHRRNGLDQLNHHRIIGSNASAFEANNLASSTVGNAECDTVTGTSWHQSSLGLMHSNPAQTELDIAPAQARPISAYGQTLPLPPGLVRPHIPSQFPQLPCFNPALAAGMVQPRPLNMAEPTTAAGNPGSVMYLHKERRGAPRKRMFTSMPKTEQPLSSRALIDDEEVLISFPEHLCLPEVMQRFVRPVGARRRIWPTERMVDFLMRHPNSKDYAGITREERRANVKRWVVKERDACNNKARKERENGKNSTKKTISTPAQQSGPPLTGQPIPLCVVLQGRSEPQHADSTPSHARNAYFDMPSTQDLSRNPHLTGVARPGHSSVTTVPRNAQGESLYEGVMQEGPTSNGDQRQSGFPTPARTEEGYASEDAEGDWE